MPFDVFISHASEDKDNFVRPLAGALAEMGLKVWFDELTQTLGDSLRQKIDGVCARRSLRPTQSAIKTLRLFLAERFALRFATVKRCETGAAMRPHFSGNPQKIVAQSDVSYATD